MKYIKMILVFFLIFISSSSIFAEVIIEKFSLTIDISDLITISPYGRYVLILKEVPQSEKNTEFFPGGVAHIYNNNGDLLWSKKFDRNISFSSHGNFIYEKADMEFTHTDYVYRIFFTNSGETFFSYNIEEEILSFDIDNNHEYIVAGTAEGNILLFKNKELIDIKEVCNIFISDISFSKDGNYIFDLCSKKVFKIINERLIDTSSKYSEINGNNLNDNYFIFTGQKKNKRIYFYDEKLNKIFKFNHTYNDKSLLQEFIKKSYNINTPQIISSSFNRYYGVKSKNRFYYLRITHQ